MKRILIAILVILFAFPSLIEAQRRSTRAKAKKPPCKATLALCPDEGCGASFDPNLNRRKNITSDSQTPTPRSLTWMKQLKNPKNFVKGGDRTELADLGEGQSVTVVAYLLIAKPEGAESCNCGLTGLENTDNHLVLVTRPTLSKKTFHERELVSITAEITPRVRLEHPKWTRKNLQFLIGKTFKYALLVRVTGLLLFDSEHFLGHHLVRVNDWEIHPILELEYCTNEDTCKADSDEGWKSLDDF